MRTGSAGQDEGVTLALPNDGALVEAARSERRAFEALYQRYVDRVYAYLRARTSSEAEAADLTQEVFLRALDALPSFRGPAFGAWLFRIARNRVIDGYRRRRPTLSWERVSENPVPAASRGDPEEVALRREALQRLRTLVRSLDNDRQELLALRFAAGLSVAEIAAVTGKSEGATQRKLHRTIQMLREHYHENE